MAGILIDAVPLCAPSPCATDQQVAPQTLSTAPPALQPLLCAAGFIELARYRAVRDAGLLTKWSTAVAANPDIDYTDPAFTQPMR